MGAISIGLPRGSRILQLDGSRLQNDSPISFVFYLIALDYPRPDLASAQPLVGCGIRGDTEFAYAERPNVGGTLGTELAVKE